MLLSYSLICIRVHTPESHSICRNWIFPRLLVRAIGKKKFFRSLQRQQSTNYRSICPRCSLGMKTWPNVVEKRDPRARRACSYRASTRTEIVGPIDWQHSLACSRSRSKRGFGAVDSNHPMLRLFALRVSLTVEWVFRAELVYSHSAWLRECPMF